MKFVTPRNAILTAGITLLLMFGTRAYQTDKDIPANVQALLLLIISGGLAVDPLTEAARRIGKKEEPKNES